MNTAGWGFQAPSCGQLHREIRPPPPSHGARRDNRRCFCCRGCCAGGRCPWLRLAVPPPGPLHSTRRRLGIRQSGLQQHFRGEARGVSKSACRNTPPVALRCRGFLTCWPLPSLPNSTLLQRGIRTSVTLAWNTIPVDFHIRVRTGTKFPAREVHIFVAKRLTGTPDPSPLCR